MSDDDIIQAAAKVINDEGGNPWGAKEATDGKDQAREGLATT